MVFVPLTVEGEQRAQVGLEQLRVEPHNVAALAGLGDKQFEVHAEREVLLLGHLPAVMVGGGGRRGGGGGARGEGAGTVGRGGASFYHLEAAPLERKDSVKFRKLRRRRVARQESSIKRGIVLERVGAADRERKSRRRGRRAAEEGRTSWR